MKKHALLGLRGLLLVGLLAAGAATLPSPMTASWARERQTVAQGLTACYAWCRAHRTGNELSACSRGCDRYWFCNGRDANTQAHRDVCAIATDNSTRRGADETQPPTHMSPDSVSPSGDAPRKGAP
jgi:hypothetical protein